MERDITKPECGVCGEILEDTQDITMINHLIGKNDFAHDRVYDRIKEILMGAFMWGDMLNE